MIPYKWQFSPRFRRHAFGWKSQPAILRIKEAVSEIRQVARKEAVLAAEGAVLFIEKLSPAIEHVDSSSGAIGTAVNRAIESLVSIIANAQVEHETRQKWLERLWHAVEDDEIPYLELLGDCWGELCATPDIASRWADEFIPMVERGWDPQATEFRYFKGTSACLSALYAAGRHQQLLALLDKARFQWWPNRRWGVKSLVAMGKHAEAIRYAEESNGLNAPVQDIALTCEAILLVSGFAEEAYRRYALDANQGTTHLATFRAIAKKYPGMPADTVLRDLVARHPGQQGKWFAAAKDAGLFDLAIELVSQSPADPRTLARAARDYATEQSDFAMAAGMAALRHIAQGHGYEITGTDVLDAYSALMKASAAAGRQDASTHQEIREFLSDYPTNNLVYKILSPYLHS
ncbi:hypothetical protein [Noviherbaspirillum malthae]|uniref:hypothetical protein n=1 Tax=Noviherbaspirillum malthae TaxID=1260987 RepID=UPI00188F3CC5|nr:hypothetical protein [Noviherbaspirillum malthae]